jgi:hypothetical protein
LIREASNFRFGLPDLNKPDTICELYSNHVAAHIISLLSIARLLDDDNKLMDVVYGNRGVFSVPLLKWFNRAVYGESDNPIPCYRNSGGDASTSHPSFQTDNVAPGEIEDRYRNANPAQGFGYTLGVLKYLYNIGFLLKNSGYDFLNYQGLHHQSIKLSTKYYACFGEHVGFGNTVTASNAAPCPDYQQYIGKVVVGLQEDVLMGAYQFPDESTIVSLDESAKASAGQELLDAIQFGRWRD